MDGPPGVEPDYRPLEREELGQIDYFLTELRSLRDRGLVPPEAVVTAESETTGRRSEIERSGLAAGAIKAARACGGKEPRRALELVETARGLDPSLRDAWALSADFHAQLGEFDRAISVCQEAADIRGFSDLLERIPGFEFRRDVQHRAAAVDEALERGRAALGFGDAEAAFAACQEALHLAPQNPDVLVLALKSLLALGRFDDAEAACAVLRKVRPNEAASWAPRIRNQRSSHAIHALPPIKSKADHGVQWVGEADVVPVTVAGIGRSPVPLLAVPIGPGLSWSTVTAEFLEEHWQKLILSLAVLLIVVSSTVGAAMVLGDRFWMAEAKCLLATAYTILFAGFGRGLSRWGAERAGRIMRLTTLMVLPVSFALVGELPGLGRSSGLSLLVLAIDSAAMMGLVWIVCRSLGIAGGKGTPLTLMALGMLNAITPQSAAFSWGFSAMCAASLVFALSGEWLGAWIAARPPDKADQDDAFYFAFGLLAFYYASTVGRIGMYVLHLHPTLYALPAMVAAAVALRVADGLKASGHPTRPVAFLRLAGFALTALAFALGLSRPPDHSPLYSGNTLLVAMIGLFLYSRALRIERRPAFLYASFAALFLAYFGTHEFIKDVFSPVEGRIGRALGYGGKLPIPFKALNGILFNTLLVGLSILFARRWNDRRLANHCHWIGLPLSVAACILSGFEPLAAVFTMGGYTIAYAVTTWLFATPALAYLSCAAFAGTAIAASTFLGDLTTGAQSLALATVGLALWSACRLLAMKTVPTTYRVPVVRSSRIAAALALTLAALAAWSWDPPSLSNAIALWAVAVLYVLICLEDPRETMAYASTACVAVACLVTTHVVAVRMTIPIGPEWFGVGSALLALIYQTTSAGMARMAARREMSLSRPSRIRAYPTPLFQNGVLLAILATWLVGSHLVANISALSVIDLAVFATAMTLVAVSLAVSSALSRSEQLAYTAVLAGMSGLIAAAMMVGLMRGSRPSVSGLSLACAGVGLVLVLLGDRIRFSARGWLPLFRRPFLSTMFLAIGLAWAFGGWGWHEPSALTAALVLTALTLVLAVRQVPFRPVPELALLSGLAAWLIACGVLDGRTVGDLPRDGLLIAVYVVAVLAMAEMARFLGRHRIDSKGYQVFVSAVPELVAVCSLAALAMGGVGLWTRNDAAQTGVLGLLAIVFLWLPRFRREAALIHAGLILAWLATTSGTRWAIGDLAPGIVLAWLALATAVDVLLLNGLRWAARKRGLHSLVLDPLRDLGLGLAIVAFGLAIGGSGLTLDAYPPAVSALLCLIVALVFSAAMDRSPWRVYGAVVVGVAASYLTMFELGRGRSGHISSLGVLASLLAVVLWGVERLASWRARGEWREIFVVPSRNAIIVLSVLAILPDWHAPRALLLASLPFLLLIRSLPAAGWLYPALILLGASGAFFTLDRSGRVSLVPLALAAAFACWTFGLVVWRWRPKICRGLGLPEHLPLEFPLYHAAMGLALAAIGLRLDTILNGGDSWSSKPWIPAVLAILALVMLKPYPGRGWVDLFVALMSLAVFTTVAPDLSAPMSWVLVAMTLALLWRAVEWAAIRAQSSVCERLGIGFDRLSVPLGEWSLGLVALAALPLTMRVAASVLASTLDISDSFPATSTADWFAGLMAILLFGANVELAARSVRGTWSQVGLHTTATLAVWWIAIPASPLMKRLGLDSSSVIPIATAIQALVSTVLGIRTNSRLLILYAFGLALVGVILTGGNLATATTASLFLATAVSVLVALTEPRKPIAGVASLLWCAAMGYLSMQIAHRLGRDQWPYVATVVALAQVVAAVGLVAAGGWARKWRRELAEPVEWIALTAMAISVLAVAMASLAGVGSSQAILNVGVMFAVASLSVIVASRWESLTMAFAAQAAILLGYAAFRSGFVATPAWDSAAMMLLAGIDLGLAEITGRGRRLFAVPAMATGLALPIVAVALSMRDGLIGDVPMFVLFASGTFYAATSARMHWRSLGYAAAVVYNAALWVLWSRFGWEMAHDPQFFIVPVGFTTILFAEANRRELGSTQVSAIRGVGLAMIYLSLAVPIWQTASLLAWAVVLLVSLLGIFAGIGLRSQAFLWLGLGGFVLDVVYQLGRIGLEHALAKWAIMLALGIGLVMFVALNEKKRLVETLRKYVDVVRQWE